MTPPPSSSLDRPRWAVIRFTVCLSNPLAFALDPVVRADVGELEDKGIYLTRQDDSKQRLERSMMADQLSQHFRNRPYMYGCVYVYDFT